MLIENIFLDQTFQLYKSNGILPASYVEGDNVADREKFKLFVENFAKFLYNYLNRTNPSIFQATSELITSVTNYQDLLRQLKVTSGASIETNDSHDIVHFSIRHPNVRILQRQTIVFIKKRENRDAVEEGQEKEQGKSFNTIVLVKSSNPSVCEALLRIVESIDTPYPIILKPKRISQDYIKEAINKMSQLKSAKEFGDVELSFQTGQLVGDSLRQISVAIPQADLCKFTVPQTIEESPQLTPSSLTSEIFSHLKQISAINFHQLPLSRFTSRIVNISQDGKIKIHRAIQVNEDIAYDPDFNTLSEKSLVWYLLVSLFAK